jgi:hypothetical protein
MNQTVVQWLKEKLIGHLDISERYKKELFEQAKEMEKEQSECICVNVIDRILDYGEQGKEINSKQIFEDVYNETFKSE